MALLWIALDCTALAQRGPPVSLRLQGLRTVQHRGGFKAAAYLPDGTLVLLEDQGDGLRLLKTDAGVSTLLTEAHLGTAGDAGIALATDGGGNIYVGGTVSSGSLAGTPGAAFSAPADASVNSFVAKFDADLQLTFLSFLGASNTALTGVAVTGDAVFATGVTFSTSLPTTPGAVLPAPASGSSGNGFVERLTTDGSTVVYATYLTGSGGDTAPAAIAADTLDHAYIVGSTSSPTFPSFAALQPTMLGTNSGFVTELTPGGDGFTFSTFVAGSGLASIALDASTDSLLATGDLSLGQFPVQTVAAPIAATPYQAVLRLSADGGMLLHSALLIPGSSSSIVSSTNGAAWVTGSLTAPANGEQADAGVGDSYLLHLTSADAMDSFFRFGGHPTDAPQYASLRSTPGPPALSVDGTAVLVPATITAITDPSYAGSQTFELGLATNLDSVLPSTVADLLPATCSPGLPCGGTGGLLSLFGAGNVGASLLLSSGSLPALAVRNAGPGAATGLQLTANGFTLNTDCPATLASGAQCGALLTGSGPGSVTAAATNTGSVSLAVSTPLPVPVGSLVLDAAELNFGIVTAAGSPVLRTFSVANLGTASQRFASAPDAVPSSAPYTLSEAASTCSGPSGVHTLSPSSSCTVTVALTASSLTANDSTVGAAWAIGGQSIPVSGFTQAVSLAVSASTLDFGASLGSSTARLPRFLYLSNPSPFPIAHVPVTSPLSQPFLVNDECPATLQPNSVCGIGLMYTQTSAPAIDTLTLALDEGLSVLVTGETLSPPSPTPLAPLPVSVSPGAVQFVSTVPVSGVSTEVEVVQITNTSANPLTLGSSVLGDFLLQNTCPPVLPSQASCDVGIQFAPSQPSFREGLLTFSAGSGYGTIVVPLSGNAEPLLSLNSDLDLGETPVGEPVTAWFQIDNTLPHLALAVSGTGFGIAVLPDDGSGHGTLAAQSFSGIASGPCIRCWIGIQFLPGVTGAAAGTLQVSTATAGNPYVVALKGLGLATDGLLLTPGKGSFGALPLNSTSAPSSFTLTNALANGNSIQIQQVTATGDFHVLQSAYPQTCTSTLAPTAACSLQIAFAPTQVGTRSGTLNVVTSAGTATASLDGTGTASGMLGLNPTTLTFTQGATQSVTVTNAGTSPLSILPPAVSGSAFSVTSACALLVPGASCTAVVSFQPEVFPALGTLSLSASSTDASGGTVIDTYAVPLSGTGTLSSAGLSVFPSGADFGTVGTGSLGQVRQFSLTNTSASALHVTLAASRNFPLATPVECSTLAAGATCTFSVIFLPETAGPLSGTVVASATGSNGASAGLALAYVQGYGASSGAIYASDGTDANLPLNFGQVGSGQTASQVLTLTNTGATSVTIRRLSTTAPFQAASNCAPTLAAGSSCAVNLVYAPVYQVAANATLAPRADRGTLLVESDASTSADTIYLSGAVLPSVQSASSVSGAVPTYTMSQSALTFPNTAPGSASPTQAITLSNNGFVPVAFGVVVAPAGFAASTDCTLLQPGASCSVMASFAPVAGSAPSLQAQTLEIVTNAATALESVSLLGSSFSAPLQLTPAATDFGDVLLGVTAQLTFTLANVSTLPVSLGDITAGGNYNIVADGCPAAGGALPAGQSCTLVVSFTPNATGPQPGTLTVASPDLQQPLGVPLAGTGIAGHLQVSVNSLEFGTVDLNTQATMTLHLANTGTAELSGVSVALSGADAALFTLGATCAGALPVGATCDLQVSFTPVETGPRTATLALLSSDPASPSLVFLAGTGAQPPGFLLTVDGQRAGAITIHSGATAVFPLLLTPEGGYATPVALACTPLRAAPNATCTLSGAQISPAGGAGSGSASLATLSGLSPASPSSWTSLLFAPGLFAFWRMRRSRRPLSRSLTAICALGPTAAAILGCGGNIGVTGYPYTPPGTYVYQVTATSTAGPSLASGVTLTVVVQ